MTAVTKALIVDQPWIDLILSGRKTWEMRGTGTSHRGWFGLIRKGSGQVVGAARMTGSGAALTQAEMIATMDRHHIPEHMIRSGAVAKWTTPWHLSDARPLGRPVAYNHPYGAVTWVNLEDEVIRAIAAQMDLAPVSIPSAINPMAERKRTAMPTLATPPAAAPSGGSLLGEVQITQGNLTNNHFYLRSFLHRFPELLIGGRDHVNPVLALVEAEGMPPARTDICPRHRFFRDRAWTRRFFANHDAAPGDRVRISQIAPLHYGVKLLKGAA